MGNDTPNTLTEAEKAEDAELLLTGRGTLCSSCKDARPSRCCCCGCKIRIRKKTEMRRVNDLVPYLGHFMCRACWGEIRHQEVIENGLRPLDR